MIINSPSPAPNAPPYRVTEEEPGRTGERPFACPRWLTFGEDSVSMQISDAAAANGRVWVDSIQDRGGVVEFWFSGRLRETEMDAIAVALGPLLLAIVDGRLVMVAKCW